MHFQPFSANASGGEQSSVAYIKQLEKLLSMVEVLLKDWMTLTIPDTRDFLY